MSVCHLIASRLPLLAENYSDTCTHRIIISWNNTNRCMYCCEQTVCACTANRVGGWSPAKSLLLWASSFALVPSSPLLILFLFPPLLSPPIFFPQPPPPPLSSLLSSSSYPLLFLDPSPPPSHLLFFLLLLCKLHNIKASLEWQLYRPHFIFCVIYSPLSPRRSKPSCDSSTTNTFWCQKQAFFKCNPLRPCLHSTLCLYVFRYRGIWVMKVCSDVFPSSPL